MIVVESADKKFINEAMRTRSVEFPRNIHFGWRVDRDLIKTQRIKGNQVRTALYTNLNWIPSALFNQLKKLANIYFIAITLLAYIPGSPKKPELSLITLAVMLTFLVIKDGQEDKTRRMNDKLTNDQKVNVYWHRNMGFLMRAQSDIRQGDLITVFNNQEVPADLLILMSDNGQAYFDTVSLDGETILTERFASMQE